MKFLRILKNIFVWLVAILAVAMMAFTVVSVATFDRTDRSLFGYRAFIVLSDSMSRTDFSAGDLVLVSPCDPAELKEGDIISFISQDDDSYGEIVTHKIRRITTNESGEPAFVTYGTTTDTDDASLVSYGDVLGIYRTRIPKVGAFFSFLKTTPGYVVCILAPFLILILMESLRCVRLFRQYKAEQQALLARERRALAAEREQTQQMMAELQKMRAEMSRGQAPAPQNTQDAQPYSYDDPIDR